MKLSLLIPTYNRVDYVKDQLSFINSLPVLTDVELEVVVGDNSDNSKTEDYIRTNNFNNVKYYRNENNIGYGRNVLKCYKSATGDYLWLLGDKNYFDVNNYRNIVGLLHEKHDAVLIADKIGIIQKELFNDVDILVKDFGFRFSNLNCSILSSDCKTILERCLKYADLNFSHVAVILEYLCSLNHISVIWYQADIFKLRNSQTAYWRNNVFQVFAHDWFYTIMALPSKISVSSKLICMRGQDTRYHIFSPYTILKSRILNTRHYSIKDLKNNREYIELTSFTTYWKSLIAIFIPVGLMRLLFQMCKILGFKKVL